MNRILLALFAASLAVTACSSSPNREQIGTVGGAVLGGTAGSAVTGGSKVGTIGGAAAGAIIGKEVGEELDKK